MNSQAESLFATVVENVSLSVFVTDTDGVIEYVNASGHEKLGRSARALVGARIDGLLYGEASQQAWHEVHSQLLSGGSCDTRLNLVREDGSEVNCELHALKREGDNGTQTRLILIFRDVSGEMQSARNVEEKNVQMAKMNAELMRSNSELRRISELKSNFLSIASHELKTPLTSIKGYSDIIIDTMKGSLEPGIYSMVTSINRAADRLHRVVNNILDATRIEKRRLRLNPEEMNLVEVIRESIDELGQFSRQRDITFDFDAPEDLPTFFGDRMRMQQVFVNLFSNALKYSPDHSTVFVRVELEENVRFHISVRDQGIGIPIEEQRRIFQPFYEIGSVTKHSTDPVKFLGGGTGLGLSIVRGIVERHGGRVWVRSEGMSEGRYPGSDFHIVVPARPAIRWDDDASREEPLWPSLGGTPSEGEPKDERLVALIMDPDPESVEVVRMALESTFTVYSAADGGEGLELAFEKSPQLVLIERELPVLDGCRVCRILRSQDETVGAAIAFLSGTIPEEELYQCFVCGADDYIIKPASTNELSQKAQQLIEKRSKNLEHRLR